MATALIVVDVQQGFHEHNYWGPRNNYEAETNIKRLLTAWRQQGLPIVIAQHHSTNPASPLRPDHPGCQLEPWVLGEHALLVAKSVNSAFHGTPDLHQWLNQANIHDLVICGATTNHCCETAARIAANLGYNVRFALDATFTHDRRAPDGTMVYADQLALATAASLHQEFADVCSTQQILDKCIA